MIRKFIELHYSAMIYKQKGIPHDWLGRMAFIFNFHLFFIISSIIFNIIFWFDFRFEDQIVYYLIAIVIGFFVFYLNNGRMKDFILKYEPQKKYKKTKPLKNLINLLFVIMFGLLIFYLFILSFKIQNYI